MFLTKGNLTETEIKKEDIKFLYRGTNLSDNYIILSAKLRCSIGKKNEIEQIQNSLIEKKKIISAKSNKNLWKYF